MERKENLLDVLKTIFRRKKTILYICGIVGIGTLIFSLMKDDYYMATTLFYAANHDLAKPVPLGETGISRNYYGIGEDIDRILAICNSNRVADYLIEEFDLYNHYEIDTTTLKSRSKIKNKFFELFTITKTKYDGIEISVEDIDPELAAKIANAGRERVNTVAQNMIKQSQAKEIAAYKNNIETKSKSLRFLSDSLSRLRTNYGIYNTDSQSKELPEMVIESTTEFAKVSAALNQLKKYAQIDPDTIIMLEADLKGIEEEVKMSQNRLNLFQEGVSNYEEIYRLHQVTKDQLAMDNNMLQQLQAAYDNDFTAVHLIEKASVPLIKSRPKRTIIILGAMFIAFVFSIMGILLFETYKDINWSEIVNG